MKDEIEEIIPLKLPRGRAISQGKFVQKVKRLAGINEDLLGPINQPERSKREDAVIKNACIDQFFDDNGNLIE